MRVVAIVQARMGSKRLRGKAMLPIWRDTPLLELVLQRVGAAKLLDEVVLATTTDPADDVLADLAGRVGKTVVRGPGEDVLARFALAVDRHPADAVVRICADNPFVDPVEIDRLVTHFVHTGCDYATNATPASGLPDGVGAEILSAGVLRLAADSAVDPYEREHVTPYVTRRPDQFRLESVPPPDPPWPYLKLDVDSEDDYERLRAVAARLPEDIALLWPVATVVAACR